MSSSDQSPSARSPLDRAPPDRSPPAPGPSDRWLDLSLEALPAAQADRVRVFRMLLLEGARLRGLLDRALAPSGVTSQQGALLSWIQAQPQPPTISAVGAALAMTHQNVKQIASALQRKGLLDIEVDPGDRRARRLVLTERHHRLWRERNPDDFAAVQRWMSAWRDDEIAQVLALLRRLHRHLDATPATSTTPGESSPGRSPGP